ncbi:Proteasome subunit alpha type-2 [Liparis tanakae]|uniref:Proteasome subunit alpha type-2 n=1 Tax=Liparis tanakae TaxID=230148 RepID=A0A4Z2EGS4_9TELE|nr:Proteasome subunit alpha type-2 [Liparis tanakae]
MCLSRSPSGKLVQIEYALAAVAAGAPSVGIKGRRDRPELRTPLRAARSFHGPFTVLSRSFHGPFAVLSRSFHNKGHFNSQALIT